MRPMVAKADATSGDKTGLITPILPIGLRKEN